jgi:hypothetical protein
MIKYGINTDSELWKWIAEDPLALESIEGMDANFLHLDRIVNRYFRRMHGVDTNKVIGQGWQVVRRDVNGSPAEWFWIHLRAEIPSGELRPYFCFQITSPDKRNIRNENWVSGIRNHINALREVIAREGIGLGGDVFFVEEPHFIDQHYATDLNDKASRSNS